MIYNYPFTIILSYVGGTFGNSLASVIISSRTNQLQTPIGDTFHINQWPINSIDCMITKNNVINFNKNISPDDIVQVHCQNAELISYKFPESRKILLTCDLEDEYFAIQRQWIVNTENTQLNLSSILSSWDWIEYNLNYYNSTKRVHYFPDVISLNFKNVTTQFNVLEDFLNMRFLEKSKDICIAHFKKQMLTFYKKNPAFDFSWKIFTESGPDSPIEDIAKEFLT